MMFDAKPGWPPTPAFLRLYVPDADAAHQQAVAAGGTSVNPAFTRAMQYVEGADFFPASHS